MVLSRILEFLFGWYNGEKGTLRKIFYFMCGFGSKTPANAHEIKYFSELGIGFASGLMRCEAVVGCELTNR